MNTSQAPTPDWDDYRHFLAVAESGSLSGAARRLGVSQPTVGRRIDALEQVLRARLFDRLARGYALTSAGESVRALAKRMERESLAIVRRVGGEQGVPAGRVKVAAAVGLGVYWFAPRIPLLAATYPELEIELLTGMSLADLMRGEADLALRVGGPGSVALVGRRLGAVGSGLYASDAYLARHGAPSDLEDLSAHAIIESSGEIGQLVQAKALRSVARGARVMSRSNDLPVLIEMTRAGLGIAPLPSYVARPFPELRRVLSREFDVRLDLWLLTRSQLRDTARVRAVLDFVVSAAREDRALLHAG